MKRLSIFLIIIVMFLTNIMAQNNNDPILISIAGEDVTKSEFLAVYQKNNVKGESLSKENVDEYLELFINYKLKVREAEALGLDTLKTFKNELAGYRRQLARPYLSNREVTDHLLTEAYERMQFDVRASHILIKISDNASAKDTLKVYNKILGIRNQIMAGASFDEMARKYSDDPSAKDRLGRDAKTQIKGNGGDLGFFNVLNLVYDFETVAYTLDIDEVSMPIRTNFGYHLIKVTDKKPAIGRVQAAHILIVEISGKEDSAKTRIDEVKTKLNEGADFAKMVNEYSDDKGSAAKAGVLAWFGAFRMTPNFLLPLYDMSPNEISDPIKTQYGWHLIKLIEKQPNGTFDEVKNDLKMRIGKDSRAFKAKDKLIVRLKDEYNFNYDKKVLNLLMPMITDSIYVNKWEIPDSPVLEKELCVIGEKTYLLSEFAEYVSKKQALCKEGDDKTVFVKNIFNHFTEDKILQYENSHLEDKYSEFKALMKEYRDGILLFDLMDKKVWSRAVKDTSGLQMFYGTIKEKFLYEERVEAVLFKVTDAKAEKKLNKILKKAEKKGYTAQQIIEMINIDSVPLVTYNIVLLEKGKNEYLDKVEWVANNVYTFKEEAESIVIWIKSVRSPEPKLLEDVKGIVTAEYQNHLETEWVKELRAKYIWKLNEDVLKSIYTP